MPVPRYDERSVMADYAFAEEARQISAPPSKRLLREVAEWQSLDTPDGAREFGCNVYLRLEPGNFRVLKAMVVGPPGTPYELGLFEFDILIPSAYPMEPPKLKFKTTVGGTVRFNWNLYTDGKVCLSLLNNTSGDEWAPGCQLRHVLLAIATSIMNDRPFYNVPDSERKMGTEEGEKSSKLFNYQAREATIRHAMVGQMRHPPSAFADLVREHFESNAEAIGALAERWTAEASDNKTGQCYPNMPLGTAASMRQATTQLHAALAGNTGGNAGVAAQLMQRLGL